MKPPKRKREQATERAQRRAQRSNNQQLVLLDKRPGKAKRERERLTVARAV